ncbi:MAG: hypothetical protein ACREP4_06570 [Stenotrophomonas sp.]|uniref:hypothetical protein n=1 Tax=Stenotrophomonas sp. TaxID=69392 RepID=UPI003D6D3F0C
MPVLNYHADLPSQRQFIRALMRDAELPTRQVTVMHRDIFRRAGVSWTDGQAMDNLLDSLNLHDLHRLTDELRDDDIEEDD